MDPPYNVHFTYKYVQCKPNAPIDLYSEDRGSGVVFSIASGFLRQKTDLVKTKEVAVTSVLIHILWMTLYRTNITKHSKYTSLTQDHHHKGNNITKGPTPQREQQNKGTNTKKGTT